MTHLVACCDQNDIRAAVKWFQFAIKKYQLDFYNLV